MQQRNQCGNGSLVFQKNNHTQHCNLSQGFALRGTAAFLCPYISPHVEASHYTSNHKLISTHTEVGCISVFCCINYMSSVLSTDFFFVLFFFFTRNSLGNYHSRFFRQIVGFSKIVRTLSNLVQSVPCRQAYVAELFSKEHRWLPSTLGGVP